MKISIITIVINTLLCSIILAVVDNKRKQVDLPEEYKLITKDTPIQGYYDKDSVLHIEFNHSKIKTEYKIELELVDQDNIKVYSLSNDRIYYTTRDSLLQTLDLDNL